MKLDNVFIRNPFHYFPCPPLPQHTHTLVSIQCYHHPRNSLLSLQTSWPSSQSRRNRSLSSHVHATGSSLSHHSNENQISRHPRRIKWVFSPSKSSISFLFSLCTVGFLTPMHLPRVPCTPKVKTIPNITAR